VSSSGEEREFSSFFSGPFPSFFLPFRSSLAPLVISPDLFPILFLASK
jgi:hypothetical protein